MDDEPQKANDTYIEAADLYRTLQDNASNYKVAFVGVVDETHRFRGIYVYMPLVSHTAADPTAMPDLQYAASQNDVMVGLRNHVLPARCEQNHGIMPDQG